MASTFTGITIDGPHSRDLDDAIWMDLKTGTLQVCIADVAGRILQGSPEDLTAAERGATRYFAERNESMLPRFLAEKDLSLLPRTSRPVVAVEMDLSPALDADNVRLSRGTLRSRARLTFEQAAAIARSPDAMPGLDPEVEQVLVRLAAVATALLRKRRASGALAFYDLNRLLDVTEEGAIRRLARSEGHISYIIIQELMILTNRVVAEHLAEANVPALYRNHSARVSAPDRETILRSIEQAFENPEAYPLQTLQRRLTLQFDRARYAPTLTGHYALNLPAYLHFTSPIRRYADLVNHRVVHALLEGLSPPYSTLELEGIAAHLNEVDDERKASSTAHFKKRVQTDALKAVQEAVASEEGSDILAALPTGAFYQAVKAAAQKAEPPMGIAEAIRTRMDTRNFTLKDAAWILFGAPLSPSWSPIRQDALGWLQSRPNHAVSLLYLGKDLLMWPEVSFEFTTLPIGFACAATLDRKDQLLIGQGQGATKKAAQQAAALVLCRMAAGESVDLELQPAKATPLLLLLSLDQAQKKIKSGNTISALFEICARAGIAPDLAIQPAGGDQPPHFTASVTVELPDRQLHATGAGTSKQKARRSACRAMLEQIAAIITDC